MAELNELGARQIAELIASKKASAEDVVKACISRIEARESDVGAFQHFDADYALDQARALDNGPAEGFLRGVPLGIKDIIDTRDMPTGIGSRVYPDPEADFRRELRCHLPRGRRGHPGKDGNHGIRLFLSRQDQESPEPRPYDRRLVDGFGRRGGGSHVSHRFRLADGRIRDPAGRLLRHYRLQGDDG